MTDDPAVLTPLEVSRILRVSDVTVRRMISRGILPRIAGVRIVLIPRSALDRLLEGTYEQAEGYNECAGSSSHQPEYDATSRGS